MRVPVELRRAYKLINHGPTTLVSARAGERVNVMAAAWVMGIDFDPPKVAAVIDSKTFTRELIEASGEFVLSIPTVEQIDLVWSVGNISGRAIDKLSQFHVATSPASKVAAPLVDGCAAWLECKLLPSEKDVAERHDLLLAEVVAAWADDQLFVNGEWRFDREERRTIHHLSKGVFFSTGARHDAKG